MLCMKKILIWIVTGLACLMMAAGCGEFVLPREIPEDPLANGDTTAVVHPPVSPLTDSNSIQ